MTFTADRELVSSIAFGQNMGRLPLIIRILIPVNVIHILYFYFFVEGSTAEVVLWRAGVISGHMLIMLASLITCFMIWFQKRRRMLSSRGVANILYAFIIFIISAAVAIVAFDQLVTPAITPFLIICLALATVFVLPPKRSAWLFAYAFVCFFFAIGLSQDDPSILLSNRVNGITVAGIGFLLSWTFWRTSCKSISQGIVIKEQSQNLENSNMQLREQSAKLETAISTRDRFLSIISHDLKGPFNSLLGFSDILLEDWDELDDKEKVSIIHLIKETSETTYQLLLNLLDWSKLQKEKIHIRPIVVSFRKLVENVLAQLHAQASLKGIVYQIDVEENLTLTADEHMINSVLRNLVSNAIKFSPKDSKIAIYARLDGEKFLCCVEDKGVGMPDEVAAQIFTKSITTSGTAHEQGTGLGLQLCKEFVRAHKGKIWVDSQLEKGSRFYFIIPQ